MPPIADSNGAASRPALIPCTTRDDWTTCKVVLKYTIEDTSKGGTRARVVYRKSMSTTCTDAMSETLELDVFPVTAHLPKQPALSRAFLLDGSDEQREPLCIMGYGAEITMLQHLFDVAL